LPGVYSQREFRRFYPVGEVTAHVLHRTWPRAHLLYALPQ
jgi:cell division protein FtsI/penicillin-binding protein 2